MSDDFRGDYEQFIEEANDSEIVWNLKAVDGFAVCESGEFEDKEVMPFWSSEKAAMAACIEDWSHYKPNPVDVDDFIDAWLHGMAEDEVFVGINWTAELEGPELDPVILIDDLLAEFE